MSASTTSPQTSSASTTEWVTFQSTPNSGVNFTRSLNEGPVPQIWNYQKRRFMENNLMHFFNKGFLGLLTSKNAVLGIASLKDTSKSAWT